MTFLGKLFVMVNVALSLAMLAAGAGLYATRIDWTESAAKGGAPPGMTARKKAELKDAMDAIFPAENTFRTATTELETLEGRRHKHRTFYSTELAWARSGGTPAAPIRAPVINSKTGLPEVDADERVKTAPAANLGSIAYYAGPIETLLKQQAAGQAALKGLFEADTRETEKLTGTPGNRGLRQHLIDEIDKRAGIQDLIDATRPLYINTLAEAAIVNERIAFLDNEIKKLEETLARLKKLDGGS